MAFGFSKTFNKQFDSEFAYGHFLLEFPNFSLKIVFIFANSVQSDHSDVMLLSVTFHLCLHYFQCKYVLGDDALIS